MSFIEFRPGNLSEKKAEIEAAIPKNKKELEKLLSISPKTYSNFIKPYQNLNDTINNTFTEISHIHSVMNSAESIQIYSSLLPIITEYFSELGQNEELYKAFQEVQKNSSNLTKAQEKVLKDTILGFELSGVGLSKEKKEEITKIQMELSDLSNQFSQNILNATNQFEFKISKLEIESLPENERAMHKKGEDYILTLKGPAYISYMTYGQNREIRETLYKAYMTRAPENGKIIEKILELRKKESQILGFKRFSDLSLATKVANTPEQVIAFLKELGLKAKPFAEKELAELRAFAKEKGLETLESFDQAFYANLLKKERYDFNEEVYKPYFEKNSVVQGCFAFLEKMFGVTFQKIKVPIWNENADCYELLRNGEVFARLYTDLEARANKKDGAWMHNWVPRHRDSQDAIVLPSAFIVCNFPPSSQDSPSLLKPSDVVTFFHEMGHAIHHLFSKVDEAFVSGVNGVEWDAVEFPSQWLENFVYDQNVISLFAKHYKTQEELPKSLLQKLIENKNFQSGMATIRQIEFALFDILIHEDAYSEQKVHEILEGVRKEIAVLFPPTYNRFENQFSHIFSGGYASGYYSYKWAELLSADAYFEFQRKGTFSKEVGERFYDAILSKGGSENAWKLFQDFMGREPKVESLLELYGMKTA